jgi:hypothetical protein
MNMGGNNGDQGRAMSPPQSYLQQQGMVGQMPKPVGQVDLKAILAKLFGEMEANKMLPQSQNPSTGINDILNQIFKDLQNGPVHNQNV